jgi:hypothetical protein
MFVYRFFFQSKTKSVIIIASAAQAISAAVEQASARADELQR